MSLDEIDKTKNLVARINDRNIFPHARIQYSMRSVDDRAEHFVLGIHVLQADSILRYREGDDNEKVFTKGDGNALLKDKTTKKNIIFATDAYTDFDVDAKTQITEQILLGFGALAIQPRVLKSITLSEEEIGALKKLLVEM